MFLEGYEPRESGCRFLVSLAKPGETRAEGHQFKTDTETIGMRHPKTGSFGPGPGRFQFPTAFVSESKYARPLLGFRVASGWPSIHQVRSQARTSLSCLSDSLYRSAGHNLDSVCACIVCGHFEHVNLGASLFERNLVHRQLHQVDAAPMLGFEVIE